MMTPAGQRNQRVTLRERNEDTLDSGGNPIPSTPALGSRWAKIVTRGGREFEVAHQVHAELTHLVELPNDSLTRSLTAKHNLEWDGRTLEILAAYDPDQRREKILAACKELD